MWLNIRKFGKFKKHNIRYRKDDNPLEFLESYQSMVTRLLESDDVID